MKRVWLALMATVLVSVAIRSEAQSCEVPDFTKDDKEDVGGIIVRQPVREARALAEWIGSLRNSPGCTSKLAVAYVYLGLAYMSVPHSWVNQDASPYAAALQTLKEEAARLVFASALRLDHDEAIATFGGLKPYLDQQIELLFDHVRTDIETEKRAQTEALEQAQQATAVAEKELADALRAQTEPPMRGWSLHLGVASGIAILRPNHPFSGRDRREGLMPLLPYVSLVGRVWRQLAVGGLVAGPAAGSHLGPGIIVALAVRPVQRAPVTLFIGDRIPADGSANRMALGVGIDFRF